MHADKYPPNYMWAGMCTSKLLNDVASAWKVGMYLIDNKHQALFFRILPKKQFKKKKSGLFFLRQLLSACVQKPH